MGVVFAICKKKVFKYVIFIIASLNLVVNRHL
nr:MAG TPA: hypothetical protein [Caudoviricetes sp.]